MWQSCAKSKIKIGDTSKSDSSSAVSTASCSSSFSFSSFKDIHHLLSEEEVEKQHSSPITTRKSSIFHRVRLANSFLHNSNSHPSPLPPPLPCITFLGADKRIVIYTTSLRVVRLTFEECHMVKSILQGFRVLIEERDVVMDSSFLRELNQVFGGQSKTLTLPRVFIGGKYFGGAKEIQMLNESGELKKIIEGLPMVEGGSVCDVCGGYGFILCKLCHGSHKLYIERHGFKTCTCCNENGLIRCPSCSSPPL